MPLAQRENWIRSSLGQWCAKHWFSIILPAPPFPSLVEVSLGLNSSCELSIIRAGGKSVNSRSGTICDRGTWTLYSEHSIVSWRDEI